MPDTTSPPPPTMTDPPPPEDGWRPDLAVLRARLDEIDDKIHDLLMDRARIVESVALSGKPAAFRPGREAAILRRLLARHSGELPARTVVRMWREMLAGTTAMQSRVVAAACGPVLANLAREHFGFLTPVIAEASPEAVLGLLRAGAATVAVLPFPDGRDPWWPALTAARPRLYVIARLPFWGDRPEGVPAADALVVGTSPPDASGADRSFILGLAPAAAADAGLTLHATHGAVIEVDGLIAETDPRLPTGTFVPGGYAIPVAGDLL